MKITKPHVALLASPGMGHLIPVLELGERFVTQHNVQVTVFVVGTDASSVQSQLSNFPYPNLFNIVSLPVDISSLIDADASIEIKIIVMMQECLPSLRSAISAMKFRPTALVVDLFGTEAMAIADEFEIMKYVFIASNAWLLAVTLYAPAINRKLLIDEHLNQKKPLKVPGCTSVRFEDTLDPFLLPDDPMYDGFASVGMKMSMADGILVNTWEDLESKTLASLRDANMLGSLSKAPVYPIGPLVRPTASQTQESKVLNWLDNQPDESVIYVSFGSGGTLSAKQMIELAWGLEMSKQRFIWVGRPPMENDASEFYLSLTGNNCASNFDYLPDGFLTRTKNVGIVVPMWAPQTDILSHRSVGGFLSHCGWNSILESIVNGVPIIAWPLFAEQKMNATMLTEEIGMAVRSKQLPTESIIDREEIESMVRRIMVDKEGEEIRTRVKNLQNSSKKTCSKDGSSYISLSRVAKGCEISLLGQLAMDQGA
ncbi:Glycosyltransferase [Melia azedarach]|uniref:Glycosyltransferase n=1 Tax=Melia azedarach TaxID=155640 RepID=A0ACC1XV55_MELAZ|nr:Glycosyltransferase [Melia azedarach]